MDNMEQSGMLSDLDYQIALQYLKAALAPRVTVERLSADPSSARLTARRGASAVVRLLPWENSHVVKRSRRALADVIWILIDPTPELREELRAAGRSFIDLRGAVRVELPGLIVDRTDLDPVDFPARPDQASDPFADRSSLVVRALLSASVRREWGIRELAQTAGVGLGTASRVVDQLHQLELVDAARQHGKPGRVRVIDAQRILDRWARSYEWTRNDSLVVQAPIGDPEIFVVDRLPRLMFRDQKWALTLQAGAAFVTRHASWERIHVYVDVRDSRELGRVAQAHMWTPGDDGQLVLMRPFYRTSIWPSIQHVAGRAKSEPRVVSNLQLVLDLWNYPLRGREQAEVIRDRFLRSVWDA
jgi:hypothetical protein